MTDYIREQAVRNIVTRIAHTIDFRRWADLRALFASEVKTDYTSLFGGNVQHQRADHLIENWRRLLSPLDATQHLLGPIDVQLRDQTAVAECHIRGYHVKRGAGGGDEWTVAGQWIIEVADRGARWEITGMTLKVLYQSGNQDLLQHAGG